MIVHSEDALPSFGDATGPVTEAEQLGHGLGTQLFAKSGGAQ